MRRNRGNWWLVLIVLFFSLRIVTTLFSNDIQIGFEARKPAYDLEDLGIISKTLRSENFPAFIAIHKVDYSVYITKNSLYKNDLIFAKLRTILLYLFLAFMFVISSLLERDLNLKKLNTSSWLFKLGISIFTLGIILSILDKVWFIEIFFSNTKKILPGITSYSSIDSIQQILTIFIFAGALAYFYRKSRELDIQTKDQTSNVQV
jgi:hypothetical protein